MTLLYKFGLGVLLLGILYATACLVSALRLYRCTKHLLVPHCVEEHDGCWYLCNLDTGEAQLLFDGAVIVVPPEHTPKADAMLCHAHASRARRAQKRGPRGIGRRDGHEWYARPLDNK